jgi:hypothetical protein
MIIKKIHILNLLTSLLVMVSFSCENTYDYNSGFSSFSHTIAGKEYLISQINSAKKSIKLSIRELTDTAIVNALIEKSSSISVEVVLDYNSTDPFEGAIVPRKGNDKSERHMDSNFMIIDDEYAVFISTFAVIDANINILYIKISEETFIEMLNSEFNQMYTLNHFGSGDSHSRKKQKINYMTNFKIGANEVEMYFLPQNQIIGNLVIDGKKLNSSYLLSRMQQVRSNVKLAIDSLNNTSISTVLDEYSNYGVVSNMIFGNGQDIRSISGPYSQVSTRGVGETLPYRVIFIDPGTQFQSMIFTTFTLNETDVLGDYDGVLLIVTGPDVEKIYNSVNSDIGL